MTDREKVIKGIDICLQRFRCGEDCPYYELECMEQLREDALTLLKEQKPVLLKNQQQLNTNSPWISKCPKCGKKIEGRQTRFCKYCGQAVKWDD